MRLTDDLLHQLNSDDNNILVVRNHALFQHPTAPKTWVLAVEVVHEQSGLKWTQLMKVPYNIANDLARNLNFHVQLHPPTGPSF